MDKKKVAIIRGSNLNKWEMQNFEPLQGFYDMHGFNARNGFFDTSSVSFPVHTLHSSEKKKSEFPGLTMLSKSFNGSSQKLRGLEKALRGYDLAHTVGTETYYTKQAILAKKNNPKLKVVASIWENIPFAHEDFPKQKELKQFNLAGIDHFIAMSERAAFALKTEGVPAKDISKIYVGVDLDRFKPQEDNDGFKKKLGCKADSMVISTVGRLVWEKGVLDVLLAVASLIRKGHAITYIIAGQGGMKSRIQSISKRLGIEDSVIITTLPYEDVPRLMSMSDIFVLPSIPTRQWQEQLGMVFIEAMGAGTCVVAGSSGSIDEVIGDAGILVPPADPMVISAELEKLVVNESLRQEYGFRGRKRAEKMFDARYKFREFREVYEKVLYV